MYIILHLKLFRNPELSIHLECNCLYLFYTTLGPDSVVINLFDKNNISTELHLAANKPRDDVTVFVVTTRSKCKQPLFNFLFQPVVPKVK